VPVQLGRRVGCVHVAYQRRHVGVSRSIVAPAHVSNGSVDIPRQAEGPRLGPSSVRRVPSGQTTAAALCRLSKMPLVPKPLGRLLRCGVDGLFGQRPIRIDFHSSAPTLLTGENGTGKSTILRALESVSSGSWFELQDLPLKGVHLNFEKNRSLSVERIGHTAWRLKVNTRTVEFDLGKIEPVDLDELDRAVRAEIRQLDANTWEYRGVRYGRSDLERRLTFVRYFAADAAWVNDLPTLFPTRLVSDQRLVILAEAFDPYQGPYYGRRVESSRKAVVEFSKDLAREIQRTQRRYALQAQRIDQRFSARVVDAMTRGGRPHVDHEMLEAKRQRLVEQQHALEAVGLLEREALGSTFDDKQLDNDYVAAVIDAVVDDNLTKLDVLEPLRARLAAFIAFVNNHYRDKSLSVDQNDGFLIQLKDGGRLRPDQLSSGEQQLLVLAYEVLFRSAADTLMLIDEPEISLHVLWQASFVDDLAEMGKLAGVRFLIATHSPTLIGGRDDQVVSLDPGDG
jgi:ABC-type transport system involved in cytochrome c biogenesis ATPase subunit